MIIQNNKQLVTVYKGTNSISAIYKGITPIWSGIKYKTITGNPAIFSDGADNKPIKSLKASIVPVQSDSGDPSPSNIRPISGWTGATVQRSGKNLFDASTITDGQYLDINGNVQISSYWNYSDYIEIISNQQVTISGYYAIGANPHSCWYDKNRNFISSFQLYTTSTTVTPPQNAKYLRISTQTRYKEEVQVEYGSTATAYESYKTIVVVPVSWQSAAGTVYGGVVDVISGELVVDRAMVDLGSLNWSYNTGSGGYFSASTSPAKAVGITNVICDIYKTSQSASVTGMEDASIKGAVNNASVFVRDYAYTDAASFKSNASGHQLCYELATPLTYQLTHQEVRTLLGNNVIGADCGPVEVTYQAI